MMIYSGSTEMPNTEADCFRRSRPWQTWIASGSAATTYRTAPHWHPPDKAIYVILMSVVRPEPASHARPDRLHRVAPQAMADLRRGQPAGSRAG